ncbi:MAG TPA: DUF2130 domain-containing protein [Paludibacter sp.]|nr:DUF2130 domain-containing protein [Paludibacter sp.]
METPTILCPNCQTPVNVSDILYHQIQEQLKKDFERKLTEKEQSFKAKQEELLAARTQLEKEKETFGESLEKAVKQKLDTEKSRLEKAIAEKLAEENADRLKTLRQELDEKSAKVRELNQTKAEIEKLKREKDELREAIALEKEREFSERLRVEKQKIQLLAEESSAFKINELKKQLEDQKKLAEEMKRKAEQGSMQLQGEVQELAIEEWLRTQFPLDTIDEVRKGVNGADCVQVVHTHSRQNCGKICYESKRTKNFGGDWIAKLKEDTFRTGANVGVLVTQVFPRDMDRMGLVDGIWVCSFEEFKGLCFVLREGIIQLNTAMSTQENKGDKMVMLYDFLTGNEFRSQIEAIVTGFKQMQVDLNTEKAAMMKSWAKRQKQIDKVLENTVGMYGSIKGIAGNAIQTIQTLELTSGEEEPML